MNGVASRFLYYETHELEEQLLCFMINEWQHIVSVIL